MVQTIAVQNINNNKSDTHEVEGFQFMPSVIWLLVKRMFLSDGSLQQLPIILHVKVNACIKPCGVWLINGVPQIAYPFCMRGPVFSSNK